MCTRTECVNKMGQWVQFRTKWGTHRGIVSGVNDRAVLVRVPRRYAPVGLAGACQSVDQSDEEKLDISLARWGYGGYGPRYYGAYGGRGRGYPGYGGWYGGWWWWWLAFA
ncbi:hypothetical protein [Alicyclobacillus dauci]|uniref:Uncharacterized protein n=1 Tax=Alicyclobacillus dauci TaxID=1475485 RepID=A0ABY6Z913_9BACL|nr:hypothetical protein [Alicyclobacillus dauci]WAH38570.1 hypothetical protein NZD86_08860 [Alicyclobacillus dauci]